MFYLIIFFILTALAVINIQFKDKLSNQMLTGFSALILICIAGLRYETGGDWDNYALLFSEFPTLSQVWHKPALLFEPDVEEGFVLLCAIVKEFSTNVQLLFFVVTFINILLISSALPKYTDFPVVGLLCYYCMLYFSLEMIYIRQATAVALCFFALQYVQPKKIVKYMLFILLACSFHRVAIVMVPCWFILNRKFPTWLYLMVILAGVVLMATGVSWIRGIFTTIASWLGENYADKAEEYTETGVFAVHRQFGIGYFLNLCIFAFVMFFRGTIDKRPHGTVHLNMFTLSLVLYYYCYELVEVSNRFRLFFLISVIVVIPLLLESLPNFMSRLLGFGIALLYCFSFAQSYFLEKPQAIAYNPYQNYIEYKIHPRPSTGKQRLEKSHELFRQSRR